GRPPLLTDRDTHRDGEITSSRRSWRRSLRDHDRLATAQDRAEAARHHVRGPREPPDVQHQSRSRVVGLPREGLGAAVILDRPDLVITRPTWPGENAGNSRGAPYRTLSPIR